jgi:hypothetical protein
VFSLYDWFGAFFLYGDRKTVGIIQALYRLGATRCIAPV